MGTFKTFEDIEAWQLARVFAKNIYSMTKSVEQYGNKDVIHQINRSAGSIMDNIAEGFERGGNREFVQFLSIAKASCAESRSQLYRFHDRDLINKEAFDALYEEAKKVGGKTAALYNYLKSSDRKGSKFEEPIVNYENVSSETNIEHSTINLQH